MTLYLSKQGLKDLKKKIAKLEREEKRLEAELRQSDVRADEFVRAEFLARIESVQNEIFEKKAQVRKAKILHNKKNSVSVAIGSIVELFDRATGKIFKFQVVDSLEVAPEKGKISAKSPLGQNLLGRKVDEIVEFAANFGQRQMVLMSIC